MSMSRRVTLSALIGISLSVLAGSASAKAYPRAMEHQLIAVCQAIKSDNRLALTRAVKQTRLSYRQLNKGLLCNGQDMLSFALTHNSAITSELIARRTNSRAGTLTAQR